MLEMVGRNAFLAALDDPQLRIKVLELQPTTLDQALTHVCRLEAYQSSNTTVEGPQSPEDRKRVRVPKTDKNVSFTDTDNFRDGSLDRRMKQMESDLASQSSLEGPGANGGGKSTAVDLVSAVCSPGSAAHDDAPAASASWSRGIICT